MSHEHTHPAHEHDYAARPHPEFVVLDIGEDIGALIIHTDAELHGVEVEIRPSDDDGRRSHKEVLERRMNGAPAFTAVFDGLKAGSYTLWLNDQEQARNVAIEGGIIAELDWRKVPVAA